MPGMGALDHPAFGQRCKAFCALWTHLDVEVPSRTMRRSPGCKNVLVIRLIRNNHPETRKVSGRDVGQQARSGHPIIASCAGKEHGE